MKRFIFLAFILFKLCFLRDNYIIGIFKVNNFNSSERIICKKYNENLVDIYLNDEKIDFSEFFEFPEPGEYIVKYNFKQSLVTMSYLFYQCSSLIELDLSNFDASNVVNMDSAFRENKQLVVINLTNFDATNVTYMGGLFKDCKGLVSLDLSTFRTSSKLLDLRNMLEGCTSLLYINLTNFNTQGVKIMPYMFNGCKSLKYLDLSSFNTENLYDMSNMFTECNSLTELNIKNFKTDKVVHMEHMFRNCRSFKTLDLSHFKILPNANLEYMFTGCSSLKLLFLPEIDSEASTIGMFDGCNASVIYK